MHAVLLKNMYHIALVLTLLSVSKFSVSQKTTEHDTTEITKALKTLLKNTVKYDAIEKALDALQYETVEVDGEELLDSFVSEVDKLFKRKVEMLDELKNHVEEARVNFTSHRFVQEFDYFNMRDVRNESLQFVDTFSTSFKINTTYSFVQVPTNIYKKKQSVLKQVEWSKHLDEKFKENYDNYGENVQYQYYGDSSGIFRLYPGSVIPKKEETDTDLFDCRRRIWYIQAATSQKDIVIVIDVSGSMVGNNIGIAKITAASIIDTLQENDYFNVISVNKNVKYIIACKHLIQATKQNKEMVKRALQHNVTSPSSIVKVDAGMDEAFKILKSGSENGTSAGCNQAIMFITDGIEGHYAGKESFERNNIDKKVRVFSYLVGRMKNPDKEALVTMSCDNSGYFYTVDTLGNVWDTVLEYLKVMSRPITHYMSNSSNLQPTYTPAYLDSAGFGMVMSISKAVFEREIINGKITYSHLVGVVGTDISLSNLTSLLPNSKMGILSRGFIINNNGFVLIHPKFKEQKGYLPVAPNILIDDLEYSIPEGKSTELKELMLGRKVKAERRFETYWSYDNERRFIKTKNQYSYKTIPGTDFIAAISISDNDKKYITVKKNQKYFDAGIDSLYTPEIRQTDVEQSDTNSTASPQVDVPSNFTFVEIAPWQYCKFANLNDEFRGIKKPLTARQLYGILKSKSFEDIQEHCDIELLNRLLQLAGAVFNITEKEWHDSKDAAGLFIATSGGYQKYLSFNDQSKPFNNDILKSRLFRDIISASNETKNSKLSNTLTLLAPRKWDSTAVEHNVVTIAKSYWINGILTAVSGVNVDVKTMNRIFLDIVVKKKVEENCGNSNATVCALIDKFGYIVASNQDIKYSGKFIGSIIGYIVNEFNTTGIFETYAIKDAQAECGHTDKESSSGNILLTPAKIILGALSFLLTSTYWLIVQVGIILLSIFEYQVTATANGQASNADVTVSCTRTMTYYVISRQNVEKQTKYEEFDCKRCHNNKNKPHYRIVTVNDTNLYLLMINTVNRTCGCFDHKVLPEETEEIPNKDWCQQDQQSYRKHPNTCYNKSTKSQEDHCGSGFSIQSSKKTLIFVAVLTMYYFLIK